MNSIDSYITTVKEDFKEKIAINILSAAALINIGFEEKGVAGFSQHSYSYNLYFDPIISGLKNIWSKKVAICKIMEDKMPDMNYALLKKASNA